MWMSTRPQGSPVKYCVKPTTPCSSSIASNHAASFRSVREVAVTRVAITSAIVIPSRPNTTSACSWLISVSSNPFRPVSGSPECGPAPVTKVPRATVSQTATTEAVASARTTGGVCG